MVSAAGVRDPAAVVLRHAAAAADVRRPAGRSGAAGRHETGVVTTTAASVAAGQRRRGGRQRARRPHHVSRLLQPVKTGGDHRVVRVVQSGRPASGRHGTSGSSRGVVELVAVGRRQRRLEGAVPDVLALRRDGDDTRRGRRQSARRHLVGEVGR